MSGSVQLGSVSSIPNSLRVLLVHHYRLRDLARSQRLGENRGVEDTLPLRVSKDWTLTEEAGLTTA